MVSIGAFSSFPGDDAGPLLLGLAAGCDEFAGERLGFPAVLIGAVDRVMEGFAFAKCDDERCSARRDLEDNAHVLHVHVP
jgi:hypothetical protein